MSSVAVPSMAGSPVASVADSEGAVTLKLCRVAPWLAPAASGAGSVEVVVVSGEEETEVASVAVSIVAEEALEAVIVASEGHQPLQADRAAGTTVTVETMETAEAAAAADTVDATTTEDTAAEAATAEAIGPAPEATPCRSARGTAETGTEVAIAIAIVTETEIETGIVAATTTATTRGNDPTKEGQATKVNANCAATDDKTPIRLAVGIFRVHSFRFCRLPPLLPP
jgi:hypothetical protein